MTGEALKQIVDLLQPVAALAGGTPFEHSEVIQRCVDATEIALEALAQPVQTVSLTSARYIADEDDDIQVYQRPWVGLTEEERDAITDKVIGFNSCCGWEDDYAKAIEAKLKEKNA
jgi:hypothetical protein